MVRAAVERLKETLTNVLVYTTYHVSILLYFSVLAAMYSASAVSRYIQLSLLKISYINSSFIIYCSVRFWTGITIGISFDLDGTFDQSP